MHGSDNLIHETKDFIELRGSPRPAARAGGNLVGRGIANPQEFLAYLEGQKKRNTRQIMCYAQRYHKVFKTGMLLLS